MFYNEQRFHFKLNSLLPHRPTMQRILFK